MENKIFKYGNNSITFQLGDGTVMVNATEMAKPFKKRTVDWLDNQYTKRFIATLSEVRKSVSSDLVIVTYGDQGGTWFHEDVAMEFARWLAPQFGIWCNDRIKELMKYGVTATDQKLEEILYDPGAFIELLQNLKQKGAANELAKQNAKDSNLEWLTAREDIQHFFGGGLQKHFPNLGTKPIPVNVYDYATGRFLSTQPSITTATKVYGLHVGNVCNVLTGKRNHTGGLIFTKV